MTVAPQPRDAAPRRLRRVVIKEELVELTGSWRQALILNQFLFWTQHCRDIDAYLSEEEHRHLDHPNVPLTHGWIEKSATRLGVDLMIQASESTVRRDLEALVAAGWLSERPSPNGWDRAAVSGEFVRHSTRPRSTRVCAGGLSTPRTGHPTRTSDTTHLPIRHGDGCVPQT